MQPHTQTRTPTQNKFLNLEREVLNMKLDSMTERKILDFWRQHEPKKVEELLSKQMLRKTLTLTANALLDMQLALQETERLHPVLARSEAWNRLMRIEEDAVEEAAAWGMTLEDYLNRP
jgi:hypothetical protein